MTAIHARHTRSWAGLSQRSVAVLRRAATVTSSLAPIVVAPPVLRRGGPVASGPVRVRVTRLTPRPE
ncbi:hypothetical protein GCM10011594_25960 [Nakamurella endophytica]|uniref:Uncharacterized protein n=1 Tax=Nakamurella endophytica TaxID=1748367 RepID=A0A917SZ27_9ACTN|nr:hypothetical protein GCM10011594_25960 [Nakamurella endophytica]